jgi:hypothetical protein
LFVYARGLTRARRQQHIKGLVRQAATHVLGHAGVVRSIRSLGPMMLPQRMHRHKHAHSMGECVPLPVPPPAAAR